MLCDNCAWYRKNLPFCVNHPDPDNCDRFISLDDIKGCCGGRKCECGVDKAGGGVHSDWCPKADCGCGGNGECCGDDCDDCE